MTLKSMKASKVELEVFWEKWGLLLPYLQFYQIIYEKDKILKIFIKNNEL